MRKERRQVMDENVPLSWPPPSKTNCFILWDILKEIITCSQVILPTEESLLHGVLTMAHSDLSKHDGKQNTF